MRSRRYFAETVLILIPFAFLGCVDSETLQPANGSLAIDLVMEPAAGTREEPNLPFLFGRGSVASVTLVPLDPEDFELYGSTSLSSSVEVQEVSLLEPTPVPLTTLTLKAGTYRVVNYSLVGFDWNTVASNPLLPVNSGRCDPETGLVTAVSHSIEASDGSIKIEPDTEVLVTVPGGGRATISIVVDGAALTAAVDARAECLEGAVSATVETLYAADVAEFVSVR